MNAPKYTLTDSSVTVIWEGEPHTYQKGTPNFAALRKALLEENWDAIPKCLTVASSIEVWAKGNFTVSGEQVSYKGEALPQALNARVLSMASAGEDPTRLFRFWELLQKNPSHRSVDSLYPFMEHVGIPLDEDGWIVAYKAVRTDFTDKHSGTVDNHPGAHVTYDRNKVSDDPRCPCHEGLHVGALSYAQSFGGDECILLICRVDPQHVVCVPYDESWRKMRVCEYHVVGIYTRPLSDTSFDEEDAPETTRKGKSKTKTVKLPKDAPSYAQLDAMDEDDLMGVSLEVLRPYAANHLHLVGASKIPGGKPMLINQISEIRGKVAKGKSRK